MKSDIEVAIIAYGGMVNIAIEAINELFIEHEIIAKIITPAEIKPISIENINRHIEKIENILIVEESVSSFGWGAEVSSLIYESNESHLNIKRIGAKEVPIPSAIPLEKKVLPQAGTIVDEVCKMLI